IQLRSLALRRPNLLPVAGREAVFTVSDPKGNKILRQRQVTSRFGIAFTSCALADEIAEGAYQIDCQVGDTTRSLTVDVRKYVLPKFKLDVACDRSYYQLGQKIAGTVQADYFFGQPVSGGDVTVELRSTDVKSASVDPIRTQTDAAGKASFELLPPQSLVGRPQHGGDAPIELVVTVRDTAGQEQSQSVSRIVTANPIHIEVLPELGTLVAGVVNRIYILASYPDGRPAKARISVGGFDHELLSNDLGAASIDVTPSAVGFNLVVRATDDDGLSGRREIDLRSGTSNRDFLVRTDKAVYSGGETMHVLALGSGREPIFLDLIRDGQTILTDSVAMSGGKGQFEFDLPAELFGPVELCAYRYDADGLPARKTRLIYVRPASAVKVATQFDQPEYRPGQRAKLNFTLTGRDGQPAPGALSLAAVDEAVFGVVRPAPGLQATFSALEDRLLQPVYTIYPWSPDLWSRQSGSGVEAPSVDDRDRFEQAIFSAASRAPRSDVEKKLLPALDNDPSAFEALNRADWEELAESIQMSPSTLKMLRERGGPHSLTADSFQAKQLASEQWQRTGLGAVYVAWFLLFIVLLASLAVALLSQRRLGDVVAAVFLLLLLIAMLLPAAQTAREASRRGQAMNNLRQLDLANMMADRGRQVDRLTKHFATPALAEVAEPPRLRQWFPETLLWRPELITDDQGHATLELDLADSITSWRLSASAITAGGRMGTAQESIRVFQPFFIDLDLPVSLTRGDEATVPVVVYNYLDEPQTVKLTMADQPALMLEGEASQRIELAPREVRAAHFRLQAARVGRHTIEVQATAGTVADAVRRTIEILPDGQRVEKVVSGRFDGPASIDVTVPEGAVAGSARTVVKIYPSSFSQLVEGLDAIFRLPYGCFEQTSSTTYPNVLALDYLRQTKQKLPAVEAQARQFIHLGCQRLLSFEVAGGGFEWFGNPPANRTLSAYGLLELVDMSKVHDVDPAVIQRTRAWLLSGQQSDGTWLPDGHAMHQDPTRRGGDLGRLSTTAYVAWSVFAGQPVGEPARRALAYLRSHAPASIDDPYLLALVAKAIGAIDPSRSAAADYLGRLESLKQVSPDGKFAWWQLDTGCRTAFYGNGRSGNIETTALAALALLEAGRQPETCRAALAWLIEQKDPRGIWPSTQATVLALKALLAGTGGPLGSPKPREIEIAVDDRMVEQVAIPVDEFDVVREIDVTSHVGVGTHRLSITGRGDTAAGYQVVARHYLPQAATPAAEPQLSIELAYDRTKLAVGDTVGVTATVLNHMPVEAPMVLVDLPIPPGFAVETAAFDQLVADHTIAKYQLTPRSVIVYLRALAPGVPLPLAYRLNTSMPVKVAAQPAIAYEYYNPDVQAVGTTTQLTVSAP
ncbi:MAG TPA: alpha-2-macroglobulin family protein, partial [Pirellulales bacterium]